MYGSMRGVHSPKQAPSSPVHPGRGDAEGAVRESTANGAGSNGIGVGEHGDWSHSDNHGLEGGCVEGGGLYGGGPLGPVHAITHALPPGDGSGAQDLALDNDMDVDVGLLDSLGQAEADYFGDSFGGGSLHDDRNMSGFSMHQELVQPAPFLLNNQHQHHQLVSGSQAAASMHAAPFLQTGWGQI